MAISVPQSCTMLRVRGEEARAATARPGARRSRAAATWAGLSLVAMVGQACRNPEARLEDRETVAFVYGRVTTSAALPLAGALVRTAGSEFGCSGPADDLGTPTRVPTDNDGAYRQELVRRSLGPFCLQVTAEWPSVGSARSATVSGAKVAFKLRGLEPHDSVRVDIILP